MQHSCLHIIAHIWHVLAMYFMILCHLVFETCINISSASAIFPRLESPTRFLSMEAPRGVHIKAVAGNIDAESSLDVILHSSEGLVRAQPQHLCIKKMPVKLTTRNSNNLAYSYTF